MPDDPLDDPPSADEERELDRLIAAHLDEALDADATSRLHQVLRRDAQARRLLLAAATHASALPRLAMEAGSAPDRSSPAAPRRRTRGRWMRSALAATAALAAGVTMAWWLRTGDPGVRLATPAAAVLERAGQAVAADGPLREGDRLITASAPARLAWDDGTTIALAAHAQLELAALGKRKRLRLARGALAAEVAPHGPGGGLAVETPFGTIEVVGTTFRVQVRERASSVEVDHGSVRVLTAGGAEPVLVEAGYSAAFDGRTVSAPGPLAAFPAATPAPTGVLRIAAAEVTSAMGWEGDPVAGRIRGHLLPDGHVARIASPLRRPAGYARLDSAWRCTLRLEVDRPTTLAMLLVCDHPDEDARWLGNVQGERTVPAGVHEISFTRADLRVATGGTPPPAGSRVVAFAIMSWSPAADLRLEWIDLPR